MKNLSEQIWKSYSKKLFSFIKSRVKDSDAASDILQEVFLSVHLHLNDVKDENKLERWLFSITRNKINDHFRKEKYNTDDLPEIANETKPENTNQRFVACMTSFIDRLPEKYREAVVLTDLKNYSQLDLAKKLNISYSGAKSRVQRGRELLKSYLMQCCNIVSDKYGNIISEETKSNCKSCQPVY